MCVFAGACVAKCAGWLAMGVLHQGGVDRKELALWCACQSCRACVPVGNTIDREFIEREALTELVCAVCNALQCHGVTHRGSLCRGQAKCGGVQISKGDVLVGPTSTGCLRNLDERGDQRWCQRQRQCCTLMLCGAAPNGRLFFRGVLGLGRDGLVADMAGTLAGLNQLHGFGGTETHMTPLALGVGV